MNTRAVKKTLLPLGGFLATAALAGSSLVGAANADTDVKASATVSTSAASDIARFWLENNSAALRAATEVSSTDATDVSKVVSTGSASSDTSPGTVAPTGTTTTTTKSQNVNLPKTIGKVFFVDSTGTKRWCSATSIQSKYENLVATAGHCVYDTAQNAGLADNWIFVPGYYQGKSPWGIYVGKQAFVHYDYSVYEDYDRDYAFVAVYNGVGITESTVTAAEYGSATLGTNDRKYTTQDGSYRIVDVADKGTLSDNVGGQGFAWNQPLKKAHYVFGYPADAHPDGSKPYTGITPKWCYGKTTAKTVGSSAKKIEEHVALKCSMTGGADGGPWLVKYSNNKRIGYLNGVTSTFADQDDNNRVDYLTSSYFDGETYSVYSAAANVWSGKIA